MAIFNSMATEKTNTTETTKEKIIHLLNKSKEYVWMSTGLYPSFYNDTNIKKAMVDAIKRVKQIRIIIAGNAETKKTEVEWLFELENQCKGKLQIKQSERVPHWLIVDGKHFRLEKPHASDGVGVKNLFVTDVKQPVISDILEAKFENWWFKAKSIEHDE